jgi:hypothetical protein
MQSRRDVLKLSSLTLGYAITGSTAAAVLAGCRGASGPDWTPAFLTADEARTVSAMVDHLLPATTTPGGVGVGADRFIDAFLAGFASAAEQQQFRAGLDEFDTTSRSSFGGAFAGLAADTKNRVFQHYEDSSPGFAPTVWGGQITAVVEPPTFYRTFKQLALVGYFASEEVGEKVLAYDPVPGTFEGCVPLASIGKNWSL